MKLVTTHLEEDVSWVSNCYHTSAGGASFIVNSQLLFISKWWVEKTFYPLEFAKTNSFVIVQSVLRRRFDINPPSLKNARPLFRQFEESRCLRKNGKNRGRPRVSEEELQRIRVVWAVSIDVYKLTSDEFVVSQPTIWRVLKNAFIWN